MKTLEQIKEEVAIEFGYKNWFEFRHNYHYSVSIEHYSDIASKRYADECAREALSLASKKFLGSSDFAVDTREAILHQSNLPKHR